MEKKEKNKINKKKILILVVVAIVIILIIIGVNQKQKQKKDEKQNTEPKSVASENNTLIDYTNEENVIIDGEKKQNNSQALLQEKIINKMKIKDISLIAENGQTKFKATVENNTGKEYVGGSIQIVFLNADNSEYGRLQGYLPAMDEGMSNTINATTTSDLANAYNFTIEF